MSYVRWSSEMDDGSGMTSDVYVYQGDRYVIHVAQRRQDTPDEKMPDGLFVEGSYQMGQSAERDELFQKWWEARESRLYEIPIEGAGANYYFDEPGQAAEKLAELKSLGFRVPKYAIDALIDEAFEKQDEEEK